MSDIEIKDYRPSGGSVKAVQMPGDLEGVIAVFKWLSNKDIYEASLMATASWTELYIDLAGSDQVYPGDWLVFDGDEVFVLADTEFEEQYRPVDD